MATMNEEYYVLENGEKTGPFSYDELIERGLEIDTQVLMPDAETWQNASYVPAFSEYFEAQGYYFPTEDNLAGFGWRTLAFFVDYMIVSAIAVLIDLQAGWVTLPAKPTLTMLPERTMYIVEMSFCVLFLVYHSLFEATDSRGSIGKRMCSLKVVDEDGRRINLVKALLRNLGALLSFMFYGLPFLTIFFSERKQTWYERLAKTYMIRVE